MPKYTINKGKIKQLLKDNNIDADSIDINSYSGDIPFNEWVFNEYSIVLKGFNEQYLDAKAAQELAKEQELKQLEEQKQALLAKVNSETIKGIISIPKLSILKNFVKATIESDKINFFICSGDSGIGKSFSTVAALKNIGCKYASLTSKVTPLMLYAFLHEHKDEVILFDDLIGVFESDISMSILLSALWSVGEHRIVEYKSTSKAFDNLQIKDIFEFTGKIILLTNKQNYKDKFISALQDRAFYYNLDFNYSEKVQFMRELIKLDNDKITYAQREEIFQEITKNSNPATDSFSFRTLLKAYSLYLSCADAWKEMLKVIMPSDDARVFVWNSIQLNTDVSVAINEFIGLGHGCRKTFFNIKRAFRKESSVKV